MSFWRFTSPNVFDKNKTGDLLHSLVRTSLNIKQGVAAVTPTTDFRLSHGPVLMFIGDLFFEWEFLGVISRFTVEVEPRSEIFKICVLLLFTLEFDVPASEWPENKWNPKIKIINLLQLMSTLPFKNVPRCRLATSNSCGIIALHRAWIRVRQSRKPTQTWATLSPNRLADAVDCSQLLSINFKICISGSIGPFLKLVWLRCVERPN